MPTAITRPVSSALGRCELTFLRREPIDVALAALQHAAYEEALRGLGCQVARLPLEPELPDSVFVEDTAVILDDLAILTRPGAPSRRPELEAVGRLLATRLPTLTLEAPATLDGGDVLRLGSRLLVGVSGRTNLAAVESLQALLAPRGYTVEAVPVTGCLHLKSAVTLVGRQSVLLNPHWIDPALFAGCECLSVAPEEPQAANALCLGKGVIYPTAFPRTAARLEAAGVRLCPVDVSELAKAEGAVTCCSLILP